MRPVRAMHDDRNGARSEISHAMSTIVIEQQQRDRRTGMIVSGTLHALILILFLFIGLSQPDPLPEEEGIELAFEEAGGLSGGDPATDPGSPQAPSESDATPASPEDVATEEESEVEAPKPVKPVKKPDPAPKPRKPNPNTLFNPSGNPNDNSNDDPGGNNQNATNPGDGGTGTFRGAGFEGRLAGRGLSRGPSINERPNEGGKVALDIFVDREGKVTRVAFNLDRSTTTSQVLFNLAKKAAMQCTFTAKPNGPAEQKGEMTFVFILE